LRGRPGTRDSLMRTVERRAPARGVGVGWSIAGMCPGPILVNIGEGKVYAAAALARGAGRRRRVRRLGTRLCSSGSGVRRCPIAPGPL